MLANNKRLKKQVIDLHLPWWLKLVKSGIPYAIAATTSIVVMLTLGGWLAMPESIQLLKWVEALFMAMSPAVKFLAVTSIGLGSFLSTFEIFSVFVRGFLYSYAEKAASEGLEVAEQLSEQNKELRDNLALQMKLNEQYKNQSELLKGYAKGLHVVLDKKTLDASAPQLNLDDLNEREVLAAGGQQQRGLPETGELEQEVDQVAVPEEEPEEEIVGQEAEHNQVEEPPKQPEPVLFSSQSQQKPKDKQPKTKNMSSRSHFMMPSSRDQRRHHPSRVKFSRDLHPTKKHRSKKQSVSVL